MTAELERELLEAVKEQTRELRALRRAILPTGTMTVDEAAEELGCSPRRVYELLKKRKITRAKKAGKRTKITAASVRAYQQLASTTTAPAANEPPQLAPAGPRRGSRFRELARKTGG